MDRDEALRLLRGGPDGIDKWNQRRRRRERIPDLSGVDLSGAGLSNADLSGVDLIGAHVRHADLSGADLRKAGLRGADLGVARLNRADFSEADLRGAFLNGADLSEAGLRSTLLSDAHLRVTHLGGADLRGADLCSADLRGAACGATVFSAVDLTEVEGLEAIVHYGPSTVGIDALVRSRGRIPEAFLRGCGLSPWEVLSVNLYRPELTPSELADLQYRIFDIWTQGRSMINGCFISYSWQDAKFVDKLRDRLYNEGINTWLDRHDMVAGTIQDQVWRAIQLYHVVIIVLSKASVESDWVENELDMARQKEKAEKRAVLCPICLDDAWKAKVAAKDAPGDPSRPLWRTLAQKLVVDFHGWKTVAFEESFEKLLRGLKLNYGPGSPGSS